MAGLITNAWAARLLEATAGKTAITTGSVYLGLAYSVVEDAPETSTLATISEVTTAGYARKVIPAWGTAATLTPPIKIVNPTAFSFAAFTADQDVPANWAFIADVLSGTAGNLRYLFQLETPVLGRSGEPLNVPAGTLVIE